MGNGQTSDQVVITDEELDEFLAVGSEALRGIKLIPDDGSVSSQAHTGELVRGNVLPTNFCGATEKDDTERRRALARLFWK